MSTRSWWVASVGHDSNPGTPAQPLLTLDTALDRSELGQEIVLAGGTFWTDFPLDAWPWVQGRRVTAALGEAITVNGKPLRVVPNSQPALNTPVASDVEATPGQLAAAGESGHRWPCPGFYRGNWDVRSDGWHPSSGWSCTCGVGR